MSKLCVYLVYNKVVGISYIYTHMSTYSLQLLLPIVDYLCLLQTPSHVNNVNQITFCGASNILINAGFDPVRPCRALREGAPGAHITPLRVGGMRGQSHVPQAKFPQVVQVLCAGDVTNEVQGREAVLTATMHTAHRNISLHSSTHDVRHT